MKIELLTIGDELLNGVITDTNSAWLSQRLFELGLEVDRCTTLPDEIEVLKTTIGSIAQRADVCVVTGGLGPTIDDITVDGLASAAGVGMVNDERAWSHIVGIYGDRTPPAANRRQTRIPIGGEALYSEVGTAPGIALKIHGCLFLAVPGVPREMRWHMAHHIEPRLEEMMPTRIRSRTLIFAGIGESSLAERVGQLALPESVKVSYRTHMPENHVRLRSADQDALELAASRITQCASRDFVGEAGSSLPANVLELCLNHGLTLGAAESCTGGLLSAQLTDIPGASSSFSGSVVCYSNDVKTGILGVPEEVLSQHGAVSEHTAAAMARGAQQALGCGIAVSITGIAGPGGGTPEKPVGTVCFGWVGPEWTETRRFQLRGDRERIRILSVGIALNRIRRWLNEC